MIPDHVLDNGLAALHADADAIFVCTQEPGDFNEATATYALGRKTLGAGNAVGAPLAGSPNGSRIMTTALTGGEVTAAGTPAAWAIVDTVNARLLASGPLPPAHPALTPGMTFKFGTITIQLRARYR
jgi:hypothetical protein